MRPERARRRMASAAAGAAAVLLAVSLARAATHHAAAEAGAAQQALRAAAPGDTVVLAAGAHAGPLTIDRPLTLRGERGAVIAGDGKGSVLTISASATTVEDLEMQGSGRRVLTEDAGIQVLRAAGVRIERVRMRDVLYGVYAERADSL